MRHGPLVVVTAASVEVALAAPALACTVCDAGTGQQVRAGVFDRDFGWNLFVTVLPFPVLLAVVGLIHFGWPWPRRRPATGAGTREARHGD